LDRIIGQFLDFGRGESEDLTRPTDLAQIVRELAEPYRLRGADLRLEIPDILVLPIRPLPFRRALANLIDNAIRYAGAREPIRIAVFCTPLEAIVEVSDQGPGIPEADQRRMLQPFTRLVDARSDTKGAGLGLAIVDRVMRAHGGSVELGSVTPTGLRVRLVFPTSEQGGNRARMETQSGQDSTQ